VDSEPLVDFEPLQPPLAVQEVAFVVDHVSVAAPPVSTEVGFAVSVSVGAGGVVTFTVTLRDTVPPLPVQTSV
jgi:hypothetical protein